MSDENNHVVVKSFAGAKIEDMEDYLKPIVRKTPAEIILHVGTNDLGNLSAYEIAQGIEKLGTQIAEDCPGTGIVLSSITLRTDSSRLAAKAVETNKLVRALCSRNKWKFIDHTSVNSTWFNSRGLYLNRKGTAINISKFIISN